MLLSLSGNSQDIHFSQFYAHPLKVNPAQVGMSDASWRFGLLTKSQWNSFTNAYSTLSFAADTRLPFRLPAGITPAVGLAITTDQSGDADMGFTEIALQIGLSYSPGKQIGTFSLAIAPGIYQYSYKYAQLYFDNQFIGDAFNPDLPVNEPVYPEPIFIPDLGFGILYQAPLGGKWQNLALGFSVHHANQPAFSFYGDGLSKLPSKFQTAAQLEYLINPYQSLIPQIFYTRQSAHAELVIGAQYKLSFYNQFTHTHWLGLHMRSSDALIASWLFAYSDFILGISYDINLSSLITVSKGRGGFEFSLQYSIFQKPATFFKPTQICPTII